MVAIQKCVGVVIAAKEPEKKKVNDYFPLVYLGKVDADEQMIEVERNPEIAGLFSE